MQWLAKKILKLIGWRTVYVTPPAPHGIVIVYPHTSNWDFPLGILWKMVHRMPLRWIAKHTWFRPPIGFIMRALGGIGIRRDGGLDLTTQLRNTMLAQPECWLCLAPEGTRSRKNYIHMGYYHMAQAANVPIGIGYIDYKTKTISIAQYRMTEPTIEAELAQLARDFVGIEAYNVDKVSPLVGKSR
ncbi:MAG: 1-acyl-sn-glycerol-3-phosphate acyltransferase [Formosimonas sp.]